MSFPYPGAGAFRAPPFRPPRLRALAAGALSAVLLAGCAEEQSVLPVVPASEPEPAPEPQPDFQHDPARERAGGLTTVDDASSHAFSVPAPNLEGERFDFHLDGDLAFEAIFVAAGNLVNSGLGPVFNAPACDRCHDRDGRTRGASLMRLSLPGSGPDGGPLPVPGFGGQLQDEAIFGVEPEGGFVMGWREIPGTYGDGTAFSLREPSPQVVGAYRPLPPEVLMSVRMPRPVFGLGLLEAVSDAALLALEDPSDRDGDGISGRVNRVVSAIDGSTRIGRFGWKATEPSLREQTAVAYNEDMGVTNSVFPTEAFAEQPGFHDGLDDDPELPDAELDAAIFYVQTLAVPAARRLDDPEVMRGEQLFNEAGCAACHVPRLRTASLPDVPEVSDQTIYPFTDLLLHDMGPGLADGRPDWEASGSEWRTPPLWGIGLTLVINGHTEFLHDGRARSLAEAVLWHGGEAEAARERFRNLSAADRQALITFLESL